MGPEDGEGRKVRSPGQQSWGRSQNRTPPPHSRGPVLPHPPWTRWASPLIGQGPTHTRLAPQIRLTDGLQSMLELQREGHHGHLRAHRQHCYRGQVAGWVGEFRVRGDTQSRAC